MSLILSITCQNHLDFDQCLLCYINFSQVCSIMSFLLFVLQEEGTFVEWKAEEVMSLDNHSEQDWAMISSVGYQPDRGSDTGK